MWLFFRKRALKSDTQGMLIGFIGIFIFSLTLPATKIAINDFDPYFIAYGRAVIATLAAIIYLLLTKAVWVDKKYIPKLMIISFGVTFGFPILVNLAMAKGSSAHGAIILGMLPLATAIAGVLWHKERPSMGFWVSALVGSLLVIIFSFMSGSGQIANEDWLLFGACIFASIGYSVGADLSNEMNPKLVISWALVLSLPFSLALAIFTFETSYLHVPFKSMAAFLYLALFSMYIGFMFWYQGLLIGGVARVSQVQLLQPFCTLIIASLFLDEELTMINAVFATLVVLSVMIGKKMLISKAVLKS